MEDVMNRVSSLLCFQGEPLFPLGVKLPPYLDQPHLQTAAAILNKHKRILGYAASVNTIGNTLATFARKCRRLIVGLSGPAIKYTALANVRQMRELLDEEIDAVGAGGIRSGWDAFEMILCSATAVQVGTCHSTEGPGCFDRICDELRVIMEEKGYRSLDDFRGKVKEWSKEGVAKSREARTAERKKAGGSGGGAVMTKEGGDAARPSWLVAVLLSIVAILLADKFQVVSFRF
ncbi:hypothetical protein ACHAWF_000513 [Thalassiosira exigua]